MLLAMMAALLVTAQDTTTGEIVGVVTDSSDKEISNAEIILDGGSFTFHRATKTNQRGSFALSELPAGQVYYLTVRRVGFIAERRELTVRAGDHQSMVIVLARAPQRLPDLKAGDSKGILEGMVVPFGARMFYSADVLITDASGNQREKHHVWADGKYRFGNFDFDLPAGKYTISVRSMGFKTQVIRNVKVEAGKVTTINPVLFWTGELKPDPKVPQRFHTARIYASTKDLEKGPAPNVFKLIERHGLGEPNPMAQGGLLSGGVRPIECRYPLKFFINGERVPLEYTAPPVNASPPPRGQVLYDEPEGILARISTKDVLEIRFVSCFDETVPWDQRNSYWLTMKNKTDKNKTDRTDRTDKTDRKD